MEEEAAQPCGARSRVRVVAGAWCNEEPKAVSSLGRGGVRISPKQAKRWAQAAG